MSAAFVQALGLRCEMRGQRQSVRYIIAKLTSDIRQQRESHFKQQPSSHLTTKWTLFDSSIRTTCVTMMVFSAFSGLMLWWITVICRFDAPTFPSACFDLTWGSPIFWVTPDNPGSWIVVLLRRWREGKVMHKYGENMFVLEDGTECTLYVTSGCDALWSVIGFSPALTVFTCKTLKAGNTVHFSYCQQFPWKYQNQQWIDLTK